MTRGDNQELKMLWLLVIFFRKTDEDHKLTMGEIIEELASRGVNANRHTVGHDIKMLREFGIDIIMEREGKKAYYYLVDRDFELAELKLLVDSVQSAKFITEETSQRLIKKLEFLASKYQGKQLQRDVYLTGRVKASNTTVFYNVDSLHEAIRTEKQITFKYYVWDLDKKLVPRREENYHVDPYHLMIDNGNYYLIAYSKKDDEIRHYRVDKMRDIVILEEEIDNPNQRKKFDLPKYATSVFGMFGGEEKGIEIVASNDMIGIMVDRFGQDIMIKRIDNDHFSLVTSVVVSRQFLGWIMALGDKVKITKPKDVVNQMKKEVERLTQQYNVKT